MSTPSMEFELIHCFGGCYSPMEDFLAVIVIYGIPVATYWFIKMVLGFNSPLINEENLTRIEYPLPQILPSDPYEPLPVAMLVGSCSEAKRCAYCHEEFDCNSARRFCFACKSAAHDECAVLNDGCSVYGCSSTVSLWNSD